jgi:periplasmic mercuric ion binding protein
MKNLIIMLVVTFLGLSVQAQDKKNKNVKHTVEVNGNCEQCQKRIQKAAYSVAGVKSAIWSIETHQLDLILDEEKASVELVKKAVAKAGYDTEDEKATTDSYDKLPGCCQYERK